MTCRKNIEKMLREQKIDLDLCHGHSQRFPVRLLNIGEMACAADDEGKGAKHED